MTRISFHRSCNCQVRLSNQPHFVQVKAGFFSRSGGLDSVDPKSGMTVSLPEVDLVIGEWCALLSAGDFASLPEFLKFVKGEIVGSFQSKPDLNLKKIEFEFVGLGQTLISENSQWQFVSESLVAIKSSQMSLSKAFKLRAFSPDAKILQTKLATNFELKVLSASELQSQINQSLISKIEIEDPVEKIIYA